MNCITCNLELKNKQKKFCSKKCCNDNVNNRNNNYENQQKRGKERKLTLIKMNGGKCMICGYNKNYASLEFHHRDPKEKESQLDLRKLSNSYWEWCVSEASKCDILCSNCHRELHNPQCLIT